MARREIVLRFRNNNSRVILNRAGLPRGSVSHPFRLSCVPDSLLSWFKELTIRSIRPTDFLATLLSAFSEDLALAIADVSFKDITTVAQHCIGDIERWALANLQMLSPGKCEGALFPGSKNGLKYI